MTIELKSMGYVRVSSTDLAAWEKFAEKVLGLMRGRGPDPANLYYRIDAVSARLVITPGEADELSCVGWEMADHVACRRRVSTSPSRVEFTEAPRPSWPSVASRS